MDRYSTTYQQTDDTEDLETGYAQPDETQAGQEPQDIDTQPGNREGRNFGCGRALNYHTINALSEGTREKLGHSSAYADKTESALKDFASYLKEDHGQRDIAQVTMEQYRGYGRDLYERVESGDLSRSTASTYLSCTNQVFAVNGRPDMHLAPMEAGVNRGVRYPNTDRAMPQEVYDGIRRIMAERFADSSNDWFQSLGHSLELMRDLGLRFRESVQIKIGEKDLSGDTLSLVKGDGMKNGRPREIQPRESLDSARAAQDFVRSNPDFARGSLIPADMKYSQYQDWSYKQMLSACEELGFGRSFHSIRHSYAQERYSQEWEARTGIAIKAPVQAGLFGKDWRAYAARETGLGLKEVISMDRQCRLAVSEDLGHGRVSVTSQYLGR